MTLAHLPKLSPRDPLPLELAPRIDDLKLIVGAVCGIDPRMFAMPARNRRFAHPRQICMSLVRDLTPHSLPRIGKAFNRDHTTVIHAARNVLRLRAIDAPFATRDAHARNAVNLLLRAGNGLRRAPGALQSEWLAAQAVAAFLKSFGARPNAQSIRFAEG